MKSKNSEAGPGGSIVQLTHTVYEPSSAGLHPTILTLHGRGANAFDLLGLAPYICGGRFFMICPQAPQETPIGPDAMGYAWYSMSLGGAPDVEGMLSSQRQLQTFLYECLKSYPIDPKKLLVLGFNQS